MIPCGLRLTMWFHPGFLSGESDELTGTPSLINSLATHFCPSLSLLEGTKALTGQEDGGISEQTMQCFPQAQWSEARMPAIHPAW